MILVMSMNSRGNQAPRIQIDAASCNRRFQEERLTPNIDATVNPSDVLCGRGKSSFTHGKFLLVASLCWVLHVAIPVLAVPL